MLPTSPGGRRGGGSSGKRGGPHLAIASIQWGSRVRCHHLNEALCGSTRTRPRTVEDMDVPARSDDRRSPIATMPAMFRNLRGSRPARASAAADDPVRGRPTALLLFGSAVGNFKHGRHRRLCPSRSRDARARQGNVRLRYCAGQSTAPNPGTRKFGSPRSFQRDLHQQVAVSPAATSEWFPVRLPTRHGA